MKLPADIDAVEGRRFLLRMLSASVDTFVEHADADHPRFEHAESAYRKMFADCPDADKLAIQAQQSLGDAGISDAAFQQSFIDGINATLANFGSGAAGDPLTIFFNGSGIEFRGIRIRETGISMGLPLHGLLFESLIPVNVGITLKEVIGETFRTVITLQDLQDGEDVLGDIFEIGRAHV